ncbi:unnamed protein product [Blepharisma stoltei]|uniref:Uncharacterized protein n=1 Tax=Blepharisma stoltei TaxID=1481888 RepID=A0AAU9J2C7_9CILI|nr:unnamed protein product [Blepharisma stoltei]
MSLTDRTYLSPKLPLLEDYKNTKKEKLISKVSKGKLENTSGFSNSKDLKRANSFSPSSKNSNLKISKSASKTISKQVNKSSSQAPNQLSKAVLDSIKHKNTQDLGPGFYRSVTPTPGPWFIFESSPRFESPKQDHQLSILKVNYVTEERKKEAERRIKTSRDLSMHVPVAKKEQLKEKAQKRLIESQLHKRTKELIALAKHETQENKLKEKFTRFELRQNRRDYEKIKRSWITLLAVFGNLGLWNRIYQKHTYLKLKVLYLIELLKSMSIAIGKFRIKLRKFRSQRALLKISNIMILLVRKWKEKRKKKFNKALIGWIDWYMCCTTMYAMMKSWKSKIIYIQRKIRSLSQIYSARLQALNLQWSKLEKITKKSIGEMSPAVKVKIPELIKTYYLKPFLTKILKEHATKTVYYYQYMKEKEEILIIEKHSMQIERALTGHKINFRDIKPQKPKFQLFNYKSEIKSLIKAAINNKRNWYKITGLNINENLINWIHNIKDEEKQKKSKRKVAKERRATKLAEIVHRPRSLIQYAIAEKQCFES